MAPGEIAAAAEHKQARDLGLPLVRKGILEQVQAGAELAQVPVLLFLAIGVRPDDAVLGRGARRVRTFLTTRVGGAPGIFAKLGKWWSRTSSEPTLSRPTQAL